MSLTVHSGREITQGETAGEQITDVNSNNILLKNFVEKFEALGTKVRKSDAVVKKGKYRDKQTKVNKIYAGDFAVFTVQEAEVPPQMD